jgi:hypothetical protein
LRPIRWRHLASIQGIEHFLPTLGGRYLADLQGQVVQANLPLGLVGMMASQAILLEE